MPTPNNVPVKPLVELETAKKIVFDLYGLRVVKLSELNGYDDKNFHVTVDEDFCKNAHINRVLKDGYLLKIVNTLESQDQERFEAQTELLTFLDKNNIRCPQPIPTKDNRPFDTVKLAHGSHIVRLLEFIPGDILFKVQNPSVDIFYQVGVLVAKMNNALQDFDHRAYHKKLQWCLGTAPDILSYIHAVPDQKQTLVNNIISEFSSRVLAVEGGLAKGVIHGDINEQNLIVDTLDNRTVVTAVIDFGDTHYCCYLYELAIAVTYMIFSSNNIENGGYVLAGYLSAREIREEDFELLKICVMARFCQSLVYGAHASLQNPDNEYVLTTAGKGWGLLEKLSSESEEAVLNRWKRISKRQY